MAQEYDKPTPVPTPTTAPFWESAQAHALKVQRCRPNQHWFSYPRKRCPFCHAEEIDWVEVSGKGKVYTYTIAHRTADPRFESMVPYVFAVVELAESPNIRMYSNVINIAPEDVRCEMPVKIVYDDVTPDATLIKFEPA